MQTSALISFIQRRNRDYSRDDIREFLNDIQTIVFDRPLHYMRIIDESTGQDPVLSTTAGTFAYTIADTQYIKQFYKKNDYVGELYNKQYIFDAERLHTYNFRYSEGTGDCRVVFQEDPGSSNINYVAYKFPTEILTENTPMSIPSQYFIKYVVPGVEGIIQQGDHGDSKAWAEFINILLPELQAKLDMQDQDIILTTNSEAF